ncbi:hypothetical protein ACFQZI_11820 [Mucilaginibacter lutimaris]|uniref:Uncharacterized protein n=1 Tax=Mucilaginibacter lutimaris TaxID=931629 RepID=A0ABW2ZHA7_9SPHI
MDKNTESHPSARLVSISKPAFWVYWIVCLVLYVVNYLSTGKSPDKFRTAGPSAAILVCVFIALILNIIENSILNTKIKRGLGVFNNVFMGASVVAIIALIILN